MEIMDRCGLLTVADLKISKRKYSSIFHQMVRSQLKDELERIVRKGFCSDGDIILAVLGRPEEWYSISQ
jgi:hypothetical protein